MSLNDSFIKEVSEEVRRDKLFKYLKKYTWVGVLLISLLIISVGANEWQKSNTKKNNQMNGDKLSLALKKFTKDNNLDDYISYIEKNNPGSLLAILNPKFLNTENNNQLKLKYLKKIENDESFPLVLRDLAILYQFYLGNNNYDEKFQILNELSGPDRPFRLLAVEAKIDLYLERGLLKEALDEIYILQPDLSNSFSINNRISNLKMIIEALIK